MVELVAVQIVDLQHPARTVHPGQPGGGDTGDDLIAVAEDPVQAEALQYHLIAHDAAVVKEKAVAQIAVGAHHGEQTVGQLRGALSIGIVQLGWVARVSLRHGDGEGDLLTHVAPGAGEGEGDLIGLSGYQTDHLELVLLGVGLLAGIGGGSVVGNGLIIHMDGVGHLGRQCGFKV